MSNQPLSKLDQFIRLLREIFELDKSDLDFGIYRVMNIRKAEIEKFLSIGLPKRVRDTLAGFAPDTDQIKEQMAEIEAQCRELQVEIEAIPKYRDEYARLKARLLSREDSSAMEADVYSDLYSFFSRYYDEGDFLSKRRYKDDVYTIPYHGEEVMLYWVNQNQYYVKTAENFKDYTFVDEGRTVHFRLVDATTEQNNNKETDDKKRTFLLYEESPQRPDLKTIEERDGELTIRFVFDVPPEQKKRYVEENYRKISAEIASHFKGWYDLLRPVQDANPKKPKTVLEKHLEAYVAKNTFDYFIHKDLKQYLYHELDYYIKTDLMHLDELDTKSEKRVESYLARLRAVKRVGRDIIDFLAQIEDFQKKLWLKKKFVVRTDWCITLDLIDPQFYPEIAKNAAQVQEWIDLYAVDEIKADGGRAGFTNPPSVEFLLQNPNLIVDTRHFAPLFAQKLIASIDHLDERTDGVLIHSENFQALRLLEARYRNGISCIYADPPYNSKSSEILYKNSFKHSSWLSFMADRTSAAAQLKARDAAMVIAIDDNEAFNLYKMLDGQFPGWTKTCVSIVHNPAGVQGDNFSYSHEYAVFLFENAKNIIGKTERDAASKEAFRDWGGTSARTLAQNCFYPIYVKDMEIVGFGAVCPDDFHPGAQNVLLEDGRVAVYPIGDDGEERKWVFARDSVEKIRDHLRVQEKNGVISIARIKTQTSYKTVWTDKRYYANIYGSKLLNNMFGEKRFDFPKSLYTVQDSIFAVNAAREPDAVILDYFAGSGTTGQAVIEQNRADGGRRKYILVEMGEYFRTVTRPRVLKSVYASAWNDGKPQNRDRGLSQLIKCCRLESYEDALYNISLSDEQHTLHSLFGDEYLIHYMLDVEAQGSLLDLKRFAFPFDYRLKIDMGGEIKEQPVDLVETFNALLGLRVERQGAVQYFRVQPGDGYEGAVELVEDIDGMYAFQQVTGTLPDGGNCLIVWRTIPEDLVSAGAALDAYFATQIAKKDYDVVYVNGDNNLENLRAEGESWKVQMIEPELKSRMFEEA